LREILLEAPWSSFDLALSAILLLRGAYLLFGFTTLESAFSLYRPLSGWLSYWAYGLICLLAGVAQAMATLWPSIPPFEIRLLARLGVCFCAALFALNQVSNVPPPVGAITHLVLAVLSIWSVLRTSRAGG
jgi:hypothetical protein